MARATQLDTNMIATIIGGTGMTGSFLVRQLLADPVITEVISVSRKPLNISSAKLTEILVSDLAELPSLASKLRGEIYFCCLGTTRQAAGSKENFEKVDHTAIVEFAKIARAHDAKSFTLISSGGANAKSKALYFQVKGRTEDDVKALGFRSLIIFQPGLLVGSRRDFRLAESVASTVLVPISRLFPAGTRKRLVTQAETLAARMLAEGKAAPEGVHIVPAKDI